MRVLGAIVLAICLSGFFGGPALAEKRVALVIGNSSYQNVSHLANPANDAAKLAATFRTANFDIVTLRTDLSAIEMRRVLRDFGDKARESDIAVIYYAGHGIEVDGANYLIPVDAVLERDIDVYDEAFPLDRLLIAIEPAKQLRLIILDACRDNPFAKTMKRTLATRAVGQGLAKVEPSAPNTLIAFAAKAGYTAFDGGARANSPYADALAAHLTKPGLDLRRAFGFVRDDVLKVTNHRQEPYIYGSLGGSDVALVPAPAVAAPVVPAPDPSEAIRRDYEYAERIATKEAWDSFLATYPDGYYSKLAHAQRNKILAEEARKAATERAHAAAEEKARLAAEGAKAAEQAKAAAEAKAAEQARLAAEKKKAEEEARLADAQRAAAAAEAARVAAENARKAEEEKAAEARLARIEEESRAAEARARAAAEVRAAEEARAAALQKALEDARLAGSERAKSAENKLEPDKPIGPVASLSPADRQDELKSADQTPRLLQTELRRLGCYTGSIDGVWNDASQRSLALFNKSAGTTLDIRIASLDTLDVLQHRSERVCPLICEHGYTVDGDTCTRIICKAGYEVGDDNSCDRVREKRPSAKRAPDEAPAVRHVSPTTSGPPAGGGGGGRCGATSCSAAFAGCMRLAQANGRPGYGCQGRYQACVQSGHWDGKFCQMSGLSRR